MGSPRQQSQRSLQRALRLPRHDSPRGCLLQQGEGGRRGLGSGGLGSKGCGSGLGSGLNSGLGSRGFGSGLGGRRNLGGSNRRSIS